MIFILGCQAKGGGSEDIFVNHAPVDNKFTLTTTLNKTYANSEVINLILSFPKVVVVNGGTPSVDITIGSTTRTAVLTSGSNSANLIFSYTVIGADLDTDGILVSTVLNKNGATIQYDSSAETSTVVDVPDLTSVRVGAAAGAAPIASNITPVSFNEDTQSAVITLSYSDADGDQAISCAISSLNKVTVSQACACAAGVCTVRVTGTLNSNGAASFNYTVTANGQASNSALASFTISPVADIPVANNITPAAFNEDVQSIITLSYTDGDADLATVCSISTPINVTVTQACACATGVCTVGVTGTSNYNGTASFNYTVTANAQVSNSALATLSITAQGDAPVASNITPAAFNEDVQSVITLSYVDVDSPATSCSLSGLTNITVTQACACAAGVCTVGVTGIANYNGASSFAYTVTAAAQTSNSATATLSITAVDDAPIAGNITPPAFLSNTQSVITLSYIDVESHPATVCSISSPTNVTVTQACACAAGVCTVGVTGTLNYKGAASFNYTVTANGLASNSALASLTINGTAPIASNISPAAFNEDVQSLITLSYTDGEADQATTCVLGGLTSVTVTQACACAAGVCTVGVTGTLNYSGAASFTYTVTSASQTSNSATATLSILPIDDAPVAANITPPAFNQGAQSIITLSYTDVESDQAVSCSLSSLTNVTETQACACAAGVCTVGVSGSPAYFGAASFNYTVTANSAVSNSALASLTIVSVNQAPVATNITPAAFNEDTQSVMTLAYTDTESDQATSCTISALSNVTVTQACACAAGVCTVGVTGTSNFNGSASFNFTVTENARVSNVSSSTFTIDPVADAPVAINITPASFDEDVASTITLSYTDAEGDFASSCSISGLTNVTITTACSCTVGTCTVGVRGTTNYFGTGSFTYTVTANSQASNSATASLTIASVEDAGVAANITPTAFNEDTQSIITLSYTDVDSPATSCSITPTNVTVTQACACAAGTCTVGVTGAANYYGSASFTYTVTANSVASNSASATFTITSVNDIPTIGAIGTQTTTVNNATTGIAFTIADADHTLACTATNLSMSSSNTAVVANSSVAWSGTAPNCSAVITPVTNSVGTTTITFTVSDNAGGTITRVFTLNVNGAILIWTNTGGTTITTYDFGTPGANTSVNVLVKNVGNVTSNTVTVTDNAASNRIGHTGSCTTIAVGATCPITITWNDAGGGGVRNETFTASATSAVPSTLSVTGIK